MAIGERGTKLVGLLVALSVMATAASANAAPGDLDPTFGEGDGKVVTAFGGNDPARAVAVQPNGAIVVAGGNGDFELARYDKDGSLDTGFGGDGKVSTDFGGDDAANAIVVQPNGKVVAAGESGALFALARYNADGTPDTSFGGGDGLVTTDFSDTDFDAANALVLQPNGKLVAAGMAWPDIDSPRFFALARYNEDGALDTAFGDDENGLVVTGFPESEGDVANAVLLRPGGKLIAVGTVHDYPFGKGNVGLAQYDADGSLDTGFGGGDGLASAFSIRQATAAALAPNGQIAVAGGWENFSVDRFDSDGSVDASFGEGWAGFPGYKGTGRLAYAVQVQDDGRVVAAGYVNDDVTGATDFAVARFDTEGLLDESFGGDGMVTTDFEGDIDSARAMALQPDGKIVVAGGSQGDFAVARYEGSKSASPPPGQGTEESGPPAPGGGPGDAASQGKARHKGQQARKQALRKCRKLKGKKARRKCVRKHAKKHAARGARTSIVGGKPASTASYPWLAYIQHQGPVETFSCTGTVIAPRLVLTAAHCLLTGTGKVAVASNFAVATGVADLRETTQQNVSNVSQALVFPGYQPSRLLNDAGLLVLSAPVSAPALPLATAADAGLLSAGVPVAIAGWGLIDVDPPRAPAVLQEAQSVVRSAGYCQRRMRRVISVYSTASQICIQQPQIASAASVCNGDSGGPGIARRADGTPVLIGVISLKGSIDCDPLSPQVLARADVVSSWAGAWIAAVESGAPAPEVVVPRVTLPRVTRRDAEFIAWLGLEADFGNRFTQGQLHRIGCRQAQPREGQVRGVLAAGRRPLPRRCHDLLGPPPRRLRLQLPLHDPPLQRQLLAQVPPPDPGLQPQALQTVRAASEPARVKR